MKNLYISHLCNIHTRIGLTFHKFNVSKKHIQLLIPCPWRLFQTIQGLVKLTHKIFTSLVHEPLRLLHVNLLFKLTIKKCNFHVHLMNFHVFQGCQCKNTTNRCKLCDRHKSFVVIHFIGLGKTSRH